MKMKRNLFFSFLVILLAAPLLRGQDLSKYRNFSIGMSLAELSKRVDQKPAEAKIMYQHPALLQELTWWPSDASGSVVRAESVQNLHFSFYNGELYKISVTYGRNAIEGLTSEDMVQSVSATYGPPMKPATEISLPTNEQSQSRGIVIARWEDSQYSLNLLRSSFSGHFELVMFSKRLNAQADGANAEAVRLEEQQGPQREADRLKKQADELEVARQKNRKTFRP